MTRADFMTAVVDMDIDAQRAGVPANDRVFTLLMTALANCDGATQQAFPREQWLEICGCVYDKVRRATLSVVPS